MNWTDRVENEGILQSRGREEYPTSKTKEGEIYWSHLAYELPSKTRHWKKDIRKDRSVGLINIAVVFSMWYALMFTRVNVIKRLYIVFSLGYDLSLKKHFVFSLGYDLSLKKHLSIKDETADHPAYNITDVMNSV